VAHARARAHLLTDELSGVVRIGSDRPSAPSRQRILVVGSSGSGKTTVGRAIADRLELPHVEMDALFWGPDWTPVDPDVFRARLRDSVQRDAWVFDGNYFSAGARDIVWPRADTVVFLDLPKRTVVRRTIVRTVRRTLTREELWSGNRETVGNAVRDDDALIRYLWRNYPTYRERYEALQRDPAWSHLEWVTLRSPAAVRAWLTSL
jgi:adenylate kinase family enzyme